jgi:peptidoglycan/LPS O-acetylase OafA/YrhL
MLHIASHFVVPLLVAALYRPRWLFALAALVATMIVDLDHLLADPVYDPDRCSIDFHPLHTTPAIAAYVLLAALPLAWRRRPLSEDLPRYVLPLHLVGVGLVIHMLLDGTECALQLMR